MIEAHYKTKKALKAAVGEELRYRETSAFGSEYRENGVVTVVGPTAYDRKWFARVTLAGGRIVRVAVVFLALAVALPSPPPKGVKKPKPVAPKSLPAPVDLCRISPFFCGLIPSVP